MKQPGLRVSCSTYYFFFIGFYITGVNTLSATLSQTPSSPIRLVNEAVEICCTVKGETIGQLGLYWYRRTKKNGDLEFIVSAPSQLEKYFYGTNINEKKFLMRRASFHGSHFTLQITGLDHSDSGVYYCMAAASVKYTFGNGTKLTVVDSLPTTVKPATKKPPCKCKKQNISKTSPPGVSCSPVIWAPLAGVALMLLIGLYLLASHTYRVYRRTYMYFRKHSPK
ncbi:T-cell surface glycoprotein CD8 beta chain [Bufo bufo]|uniref:T-cell surface glycoprotein CD8 beta chain n=1 Tax=Bufo bufo TaxID=8384 RepID=UPI001ABE6E56|nr:T-cell surface glycoprotein CD8 beta chain [Bufo bufo]